MAVGKDLEQIQRAHTERLMKDYDEPSVGLAVRDSNLRLVAQGEVLRALRAEAGVLMDEAFRARALGQESVGKLKEELAKYLLSLVASLPTKLRAQ